MGVTTVASAYPYAMRFPSSPAHGHEEGRERGTSGVSEGEGRRREGRELRSKGKERRGAHRARKREREERVGNRKNNQPNAFTTIPAHHMGIL